MGKPKMHQRVVPIEIDANPEGNRSERRMAARLKRKGKAGTITLNTTQGPIEPGAKRAGR